MCRVCGRPATWHCCDPDPDGKQPETVDLCEEHGREYLETGHLPSNPAE
jgi:hypothetical protein